MSRERLKLLIYKYLAQCMTDAERVELQGHAIVFPQVWRVIIRMTEHPVWADDPQSRDVKMHAIMEGIRARAQASQNHQKQKMAGGISIFFRLLKK